MFFNFIVSSLRVSKVGLQPHDHAEGGASARSHCRGLVTYTYASVCFIPNVKPIFDDV